MPADHNHQGRHLCQVTAVSRSYRQGTVCFITYKSIDSKAYGRRILKRQRRRLPDHLAEPLEHDHSHDYSHVKAG